MGKCQAGNVNVTGTLTANIPTPNTQIVAGGAYNASATSGSITTSTPLVITAPQAYFRFLPNKIYNISMVIRVDLKNLVFDGAVGGNLNMKAYCGSDPDTSDGFAEVDYFIPNQGSTSQFNLNLIGSLNSQSNTGLKYIAVKLTASSGLTSGTINTLNCGAYLDNPIVVQLMN